MAQRFTHVAVTVSRDQLEGDAREELLELYGAVFGWQENPDLAIPGERIFLRAPSDQQYVTIRAAAEPMSVSGYEHLGVHVDSEAELREIHERAGKLAPRFPELELGPVQNEYAGHLVAFRLRYRLPLTIEVQHLRRPAG